MDWHFQLTQFAVKGIVLAWHGLCIWNFLHKWIQSTIEILVQCSHTRPLVRLLSNLIDVKRTDWEVCVFAIANERDTSEREFRLRSTQSFIESSETRMMFKFTN